MKAIVVRKFGGPEVLELEDLAVPEPGPAEVRVRLRAIGVNPVEAYVRSGTYARTPPLPWVPGSDGAGIVEACGPEVANIAPRDRVYVAATLARRCTGTYAEQVVCDADRVHPLSERVSASQGAAVGVPCATAYRALFQKAGLRGGERVLVHGASGAVGLACLQLARAHGAIVVGSAGSERGRTLVREQGAHLVVDHGAPDHLDEVLAFTGGRGVDVIIEMLANVHLERDFTALAVFGRLIIVGSRGTIEFTPRQTMGKDALVMGMTLFNTPPAELAGAHAAIVAALDTGVLRPVVGRQLPLADAARAHREVLEPGAYGKTVLVP